MIFEALANNIFLVYKPGLRYIKLFVTVASYIYIYIYIYIFLTGNFNSYLAGFMVNKSFLFVTEVDLGLLKHPRLSAL